MRYLLSMILLLSLAGFSYAQERLTQLPAGASPVQILGKTYYQSGNTFYAFSEQGGYFYPVQPPTAIRQYERPRDMYIRGTQPRRPRHLYMRGTQTPWGLTRHQVEACRNTAASMANANPANGGKIYIREYNQCVNNMRASTQPRYRYRDRPRDMYFRGTQPRPSGLTRGQVEGCRNAAADVSNANPSIGGKLYIREYNRCINNLRR
ncbi:hypothetical protein [Microbulbifer epialgicus]|uniref:DUF4189 domain-containing protein n=1 Tax=Microbulbifer epialgicus TaxID=393907 RepID=A0ABV4P4S1_9GAMM